MASKMTFRVRFDLLRWIWRTWEEFLDYGQSFACVESVGKRHRCPFATIPALIAVVGHVAVDSNG